MPASRLDGTTVRIERYDVASLDSPMIEHFIAHVGLFNGDPKDLPAESKARGVSMIHMMPPLCDNRHLWEVSAIGAVPLTPGEALAVKVFCQRRQNEYAAHQVRGREQYVIRPHEQPPDAEHPYYRYNCAGFVIEAYRWAGIELLVLSDARLPEVTLDKLKDAYQRHVETLDDPGQRAKLGLEGRAPWRVVLAGYVLNALARSSEDIRRTPYAARSGDEFFPARPTKADSG